MFLSGSMRQMQAKAKKTAKRLEDIKDGKVEATMDEIIQTKKDVLLANQNVKYWEDVVEFLEDVKKGQEAVAEEEAKTEEAAPAEAAPSVEASEEAAPKAEEDKNSEASEKNNASESTDENTLGDEYQQHLQERRAKINSEMGDKYSLSDEVADNGELFIQNENGSTNLAEIPLEIFNRLGINPIPFKLTETMGWHVYERRKKEAKLNSVSDAVDFVLSVINNVDHVRQGNGNAYIFSVENGRKKTGRRAIAIIIDSKTGKFMGIKTSGYESISNLNKRPLLWERSAQTEPEATAAPTISTIESQQGGENTSRTKSQSNESSTDKVTESAATAQTEGKENETKKQKNKPRTKANPFSNLRDESNVFHPNEDLIKTTTLNLESLEKRVVEAIGNGTISDELRDEFRNAAYEFFLSKGFRESNAEDNAEIFLEELERNEYLEAKDRSTKEDLTEDELKELFWLEQRLERWYNKKPTKRELEGKPPRTFDEIEEGLRKFKEMTKSFTEKHSERAEDAAEETQAESEAQPTDEGQKPSEAKPKQPADPDANLRADIREARDLAKMMFPDVNAELLDKIARDLNQQPLTRKQREQMERIAKAFGLRIRWFKTMPQNGTYSRENGVICIATDSWHQLSDTFGHEMTHALKNVDMDAYNRLKQAVIEANAKNEAERKGLQRAIDWKYSGYDAKDRMEEYVSDKIGASICSEDLAGKILFNLDHKVLGRMRDIVKRMRAAVSDFSFNTENKVRGLLHMEERVRDERVPSALEKLEGAIMDAYRMAHDTEMARRAEEKRKAEEEKKKEEERKKAEEKRKKVAQEVHDTMSTGVESPDGKGNTTSKYSTRAQVTGAGLTPIEDDGHGNFAILGSDGKVFDHEHPITAEYLKNQTNNPLYYLTRDALACKATTQANVDMVYDKYASLLNAYLEKGSKENGGFENLKDYWNYVGESVYKAVATNSDSQYSYSIDITRVCKKNEAVIDGISEMQKRLGYGITPGQIMELYLETDKQGYQTPCPVCYVFSRYIRNGKYATIMINGQNKYGHLLVDPKTLSPKEKEKRVQFWLGEMEKVDAENEKNKKAIDRANKEITECLSEIDKLSWQITHNKGMKKEELDALKSRVQVMDKRYRAAMNVVSQSSLGSWIKNFAIHKVKVDGKEKWVLYDDTYQGFPKEAALDFKRTAEVMRKYPAIQRYRNSRGAAAGKEITFAADNAVGDVPLALGSQTATKNLAKPRDISDEEWEELESADEYASRMLGARNAYVAASQAKTRKERNALLRAARKRFISAHIYAQQQSLRGGQRMWSWSDNIESLSNDVGLNLMQLSLLGGALQSYTKQLEGAELVASMNGYVNGSLMGRGNGIREVHPDEIEYVEGVPFVKGEQTTVKDKHGRERVLRSLVYQNVLDGKYYTLVFDNKVGIEPFSHVGEDGKRKLGLFDLNAQYDRAGNILVGMNDIHVRAAMADPRIFFIIPWHSSGANNHILAQMYNVLGVPFDRGESTDYTDVQEEKRISDKEEEDEVEEVLNEDTGEMEKVAKPKKPRVSEHLRNYWEDHYNNKHDYGGRQIAGRDFRCGIEGGVKSADEVGDKLSESQLHYRELRKAIFTGIKVLVGKTKAGKNKYKVYDVKDYNPEWYKEIMNDEFLSQVYNEVHDKVDSGFMTSTDDKFIYPYEYWDKSSTYETSDVNTARYQEYCRRLGHKPKFCGMLDGRPAERDHGNFLDDKGAWKLLIDRRMYDVDGKFQDLTPVTPDGFNTDLIDHDKTSEKYDVTRVADLEATQGIVDNVLKHEDERVGGRLSVDYGMDLQGAVDAYEKASAEDEGVKRSERVEESDSVSEMKQKVADLFTKAQTGEFRGKSISIGKITQEGKAFLERLSGMQLRDNVDFVLNPSDFVHIYKNHFGENEKDPGNNEPLTIDDIKNMVDVIISPDKVIFGVNENGNKLFFFLKAHGEGSYNLAEVYSDRHGKLTAKSFYNTKRKGIAQRVNEILASLHTTPETTGESLSSDANVPIMFDISNTSEEENGVREQKRTPTSSELALRDGLVERLREAGLGVSLSEEEGQRVLDLVNGGAREMRVYHGSHADFDHFDHSFMNSGEGAQAYGWGSYVTEVEGIGRTYAKNNTAKHSDSRSKDQYEFSDRDSFLERIKRQKSDGLESLQNVDAETVADFVIFALNCEYKTIASDFYSPRLSTVLKLFRYKKGKFNGVDDAINMYDRLHGYEMTHNERAYLYNAAYPILNNINPEDIKKIKHAKPIRHLYTVEIPDDTGSNYLDWDNPLTDEQADAIERYFEKNGWTVNKNNSNFTIFEKDGRELGLFRGGEKFSSIYRELINDWGSDKAASELLNEAGFTGIKYPADYMRGGRADGAHNYVIFNDKDLEITDHVRFFRGENGEAYGFTVDGKIYIDPKHVNAETPIHEYAHLWATALQQKDAKAWGDVVRLMKDTGIWESVREAYPELKTDDEIADEVLATYSGQRGAERLREEMRQVMQGEGRMVDKVDALSAMERVRNAIAKFWRKVAEMLGIRYTKAEDVADHVLGDLLDRVNPNVEVETDAKAREQFIGEQGAASLDHAEEVSTRMDNLGVARQMEADKKDAKAIKMATGWERGADGMWRYEIPDPLVDAIAKIVDEKIDKQVEAGKPLSGLRLTPIKLVDAIGEDHPLIKAYPKLAKSKIKFPKLNEYLIARYDGVDRSISLNSFYAKHPGGIHNFFETALAHEVQHAIQDIEGFERGDMPSNQNYNRLSGEVEARNVQKRMGMTSEERRQSLASETEDVAREDQIFLSSINHTKASMRTDSTYGQSIFHNVREGVDELQGRLSEMEDAKEVDAVKAAVRKEGDAAWKEANRKNLRIAEMLCDERKAELEGNAPAEKFSLRDGSFIRSGSYFSGGGLLEEGLKNYLDPRVAVEFNEKIAGVYADNFGRHIVTADVRNVDPRELTAHVDGSVEYFHASPVCKNFSRAKREAGEVELDKETAQSTADFIRANRPRVVTIENVKGYRGSDALKIITDALTEQGYDWDADVYNTGDFGGYTKRERLIVRAVRDGKLPEKPKPFPQSERKGGWMEAVSDLMDSLPEKRSGVPEWMDKRLKAMGIDWRHIDKPLYVLGQGDAADKVSHAFADELLPTLRTKGGDVIIMPDGRVLRATPRVLARVTGLADDYKMPVTDDMAHTIVGNGIPSQLSEHVVGPLLEHVFNDGERITHDMKESRRVSGRLANTGNTSSVAQRIYEEAVRGRAFEWDEAWHDSLVSVKALQDALAKERGVDIRDLENVYLHLVHLSSVSAAEMTEYRNEQVENLLDAMNAILKDKKLTIEDENGKKHRITEMDIETYLNCKHGLERNEHIARKKAKEEADKKYADDLEKLKEAYVKAADAYGKNPSQKTKNVMDQALKDYRDKEKERDDYEESQYDKHRKEDDYSGLTAIFDDPKKPTMTNEELEDKARDLVADMEQKIGQERIDDLWDAIHDATLFSLHKSYKSGLISKETYDEVKKMYQWYVPLRGFAEDTANDVYEYMEHSEPKTQQELKNAKGRTSRSDGILANIMNMGSSAILHGNQNLAKQKLLNLAMNSKSSLLSLNTAFYKPSNKMDAQGNPYDELVQIPDYILNEDDADVRRQLMEQWTEQMEADPDVKTKFDKLNLDYRTLYGVQNEHAVSVFRGGKQYMVYVNGNPRAAQAINGTNIVRHDGSLSKAMSKVTRWMSQMMTSYNPSFVTSNAQRDFTSSLLISEAKYGAGYTARFANNVRTVFPFLFAQINGGKKYEPGGMYQLYSKYKNGTLAMNKPIEKYFSEFMANGGETGYTQSMSVDDYKNFIEKELKDRKRNKVVRFGKKPFGAFMNFVEELNRGIENSCRFAAYMTSRETGRSVLQSVQDAKEVSTNFNLHGSGALGNAFFRDAYAFTNPAIQSIVQYWQLTKQHPVKMSIMAASTIALGAMTTWMMASMVGPLGGGDGDDDKDEGDPTSDFWNINPYTRRNYLLIPIPKGKGNWMKIAMAPEIRALYGIGVLAAEYLLGRTDASDCAVGMLDQLNQLMPKQFIEPTETFKKDDGKDYTIGKQFVGSMMPTSFEPIYRAWWINRDFMGKQITNQSDWNEDRPEWQRASYNTSEWLVNTSKWLNNATLDHPDFDTKGFLNFNPSRWGYLTYSYFGGIGQLYDQGRGLFKGVVQDDEEYDERLRYIPVINRMFTTTNNEYNKYQDSNARFQYYEGVHNLNDYMLRNGKQKIQKGEMGRYEMIGKLWTDPDYNRGLLMDAGKWLKQIDKLKELRKATNDEQQQKEYGHQINEVRKNAVRVIMYVEEHGGLDKVDNITAGYRNVKNEDQFKALNEKRNAAIQQVLGEAMKKYPNPFPFNDSESQKDEDKKKDE